jgi:hypothetical protein
MIKLRKAIPYFIMIVCPLVIYYFLLQVHALNTHQSNATTFSQNSLGHILKIKNKSKIKNLAKSSRQGDFSDEFFQKLMTKTSEENPDFLHQLLVLEPFHKSAILSLENDTLSWLSNLEAPQRSDVLHILQQKPSREWQENLKTLQKLPPEELRTVLSQHRLTQKAPKESLDQRPFDRL